MSSYHLVVVLQCVLVSPGSGTMCVLVSPGSGTMCVLVSPGSGTTVCPAVPTQTKPDKRISVDDLLVHPWLLKDNKKPVDWRSRIDVSGAPGEVGRGGRDCGERWRG